MKCFGLFSVVAISSAKAIVEKPKNLFGKTFCSFEGLDQYENIYDLLSCKRTTDLRSDSRLHFKSVEDFEMFPEGAPEGFQCNKIRCHENKNIVSGFRIGCFDGEWREMYHVDQIGWVPQFDAPIDFPVCRDLSPTNSEVSHSYL